MFLQFKETIINTNEISVINIEEIFDAKDKKYDLVFDLTNQQTFHIIFETKKQADEILDKICDLLIIKKFDLKMEYS